MLSLPPLKHRCLSFPNLTASKSPYQRPCKASVDVTSSDWKKRGLATLAPAEYLKESYMPNTKQTVSVSAQEFQELNEKLDLLIKRQNDNEVNAAARAHLDEDIIKIKENIEGNGKPGFNAIRDRVLSWDAKLNSLFLLVMGDIVFRVITMIYTK